MSEFEQKVIESIASLKTEFVAMKETFTGFREEVKTEIAIQRKRTYEMSGDVQKLEFKLSDRICDQHSTEIANQTKRIEDHIKDAEKEGGWHDKIRVVEVHRQHIVKYGWAYMVGSGIIGGGIATGAIKIWGGLSKILGV